MKFLLSADFVSSVNMKIPIDFLTVALGDSLTLNCTYNCSSGFVRGCWSKVLDNSGCHRTRVSQGTVCTVSLQLSNLSTEDIKNYTCYSEDTDDIRLPQKTERIVLLRLQGRQIFLYENQYISFLFWQFFNKTTNKQMLQNQKWI